MLDQLKTGDILTYRNGRTNRVNKPLKYKGFYFDDLTHVKDNNFDIIKIQRFVKIFGFYRLKTIYKRK